MRTLNATNNWSISGTSVNFYGINKYAGSYYANRIEFNKYPLNIIPYALISINIPTEGWYIINVYAQYKGIAYLYHNSMGSTPIDSWDTRNSSSYYNDFLTAQFLSAGYHYFYFKPDLVNQYYAIIFNVTIDSWD